MSSFLVPRSGGDLDVARRYLPAIDAVRAEAVIGAMQLQAAEGLAREASRMVTDQGILHENYIKIAPLADAELERIRRAFGSVAESIILRMGQR